MKAGGVVCVVPQTTSCTETEVGWKLVTVSVVELVELHRRIAEEKYGELAHLIGNVVKSDLPITAVI